MLSRSEGNRNKPTITLFAGPNGSGKTTIVEALSRNADFGVVVNADVIGVRLAQQAGQLQANSDLQLQAAVEAEAYRYQLVEQGISFVTETVMSDAQRWRKFFQAAIAHGFAIHLIFVTTGDPEINVKRVAQRVLSGGHDVEPDRIRERFAKVHNFLPEVIALADVVMVFDNSDPLRPNQLLLVKQDKYGDLLSKVPEEELPIWAQHLLR